MVMRKKGMFFTISVILIILLFLASFSMYNEVQDRKAVQKRIDTLNSFLESSDKDLSRQLYISGYRIIFLAEQEILDKTLPINNMDAFFLEAIKTGNVGSEHKIIMDGYLLSNITKSLDDDAKQFGANITLTNPKAYLTQADPWNVRIILSLDILLKDNAGVALWNKQGHNISAYIPITEFQDPLYYLKTGGEFNYENKIVKSPYTFSSPASIPNFVNHIDNWYYYANNDAPSFLDRMEGNTVNARGDRMGIESFVNVIELQHEGVSTIRYDKSMVDHIYFGTDNPPASPVGGVHDSWFKIDSVHKTFYGL